MLKTAKEIDMSYQGHCADGSSVQKHSAGPLYPYIIFAKQADGTLDWGVLEPSGEESIFKSYVGAVQFASALKALDSFCTH
jgi:hypothetical protein